MADRAKQTLIGRDLTFNCIPFTLGTDGTLTTITPFQTTGRIAEGTRRYLTANERVMAMDGYTANYVPDFVDFELVLTGIKYKNRIATDPAGRTVTIVGGTDGLTNQTIPVVDPFEAFQFAYAYMRISIGSPVIVQQYDCLMVELDWSLRRLNQVDTLRLVPIDLGIPNPRIFSSSVT